MQKHTATPQKTANIPPSPPIGKMLLPTGVSIDKPIFVLKIVICKPWAILIRYLGKKISLKLRI